MDVRVLSASCADESILAYGEIVRSRSPDAGIKLLRDVSRGRRWPESPAHRGEHV